MTRVRMILILVLFLSFSASTLPAQTPSTQPAPLFTEDFESGQIDPRWSQNLTGEGVRMTVQQERVAHGKSALMVHCPAGSNKAIAFITTAHLPEALKDHHFGRAYLYLTAKPPARHTIFVTAGTAGFPKYKYEEVAVANGRWQLTFVDQLNGGEDYHSGGEIPVGRWFCLEWEFNDNPNHATIWIDGAKTYETPFTFKGSSANLVGGFTDLALGFRLWGAAPDAFDIYYDDVAMSTQPIGRISAAR